jgi:nucleoid-associated protein YgaU
MAASTKLVLVMIALLMGVSILFYGVMFDREGELQLAHEPTSVEDVLAGEATEATEDANPPSAATRPSLSAAASTTNRPGLGAVASRPALAAAPEAGGRPALGGVAGSTARPAPRANPGQIEMGAARGPLAGGTRIPAPLLGPEPTGEPVVDRSPASAPLARPEPAAPAPVPAPATDTSPDPTPASAPTSTPTPAPAPASSGSPPKPSEVLVTRYSVRPGDTLSDIAAAHYGHARHWRAIVEANPGLDPAKLQPGQPILLPARSAVLAGEPAGAPPAPAAEAGPSPALAAGERLHVVASGETLSSIASALLGSARHWRLIAERNRDLLGGDPDLLRVGMRLRIPPRPAD